MTSATNILKHYWKHICLTRPRRFVTFYISALEILLLTYLLTYTWRIYVPNAQFQALRAVILSAINGTSLEIVILSVTNNSNPIWTTVSQRWCYLVACMPKRLGARCRSAYSCWNHFLLFPVPVSRVAVVPNAQNYGIKYDVQYRHVPTWR